jgi:hypothetical protein
MISSATGPSQLFLFATSTEEKATAVPGQTFSSGGCVYHINTINEEHVTEVALYVYRSSTHTRLVASPFSPFPNG